MNTGDKVICVDALFAPPIAALYTALPKEGTVYTIRDVRLGIKADCKTGDVSLLLAGLLNPKANSASALERGFSVDRFMRMQSRAANNPAEPVNAEKTQTLI